MKAFRCPLAGCTKRYTLGRFCAIHPLLVCVHEKITTPEVMAAHAKAAAERPRPMPTATTMLVVTTRTVTVSITSTSDRSTCRRRSEGDQREVRWR